MRIPVATQNMTEGPVTDDLRSAAIVILQEIDRRKVVEGFGPDWGFYFPKHDSHQALGWRKDLFHKDAPSRYFRFHGSGTGDDRIPDSIPTPARGLLKANLVLTEFNLPIKVLGTWPLNSWWPGRPDQFTPIRRRIVEELELPVIRREMAQVRDNDKAIGFIGADWNSIKAPLEFDGWNQRPDRGLDRIMWTRDKRVRFVRMREGAKTGVGNDMRHNSVICTFDIRA